MRPQPYRKNYWLLRKDGNGKGGLSQGRIHQMVAHFQKVRPENGHTGSIFKS